MSLVKGTIGSVIGGAIGAAIWTGVAYSMNLESGFIAWGVGILAGIGMAVGAGNYASQTTGVVAALVAAVAVLGGKYGAVHYAVGDIMKGVESVAITDEDAQVYMADQLVEEYKAQGKALKWPEGMTAEDASEQAHYPTALWADMSNRWSKMSPSAREEYRAGVQEQFRQMVTLARSEIEKEGFSASFTPFDLLWFGLALATAFKLGSGMGGGGE